MTSVIRYYIIMHTCTYNLYKINTDSFLPARNNRILLQFLQIIAYEKLSRVERPIVFPRKYLPL